MFITFVGTVFAAYLSYRFFEEPISQLRERMKLKREG